MSRQKLMKLLGGMGLRDFKSNEELEKAHVLYKLLLANDKPAEKPKRKKSNDTVRLDEKAGSETESATASEDRPDRSDALPDDSEHSESGREIPVTRKNSGKASLKT